MAAVVPKAPLITVKSVPEIDLINNFSVFIKTVCWADNPEAEATGTVVVIYNELVDVTAGATLVVTNTTDSASITATYARGTGTNRIEFDFTCAAASKVHTIGAQTISGTIVDAGTSTASDKVFVLGDTVGAGGSGSTKTITTT